MVWNSILGTKLVAREETFGALVSGIVILNRVADGANLRKEVESKSGRSPAGHLSQSLRSFIP